MTVKELINFLSKQNPDAKVTLIKSECHVFDDGYDDPDCRGESWYEDEVTDLEPYCLTVDVLGNGDVNIRWI